MDRVRGKELKQPGIRGTGILGRKDAQERKHSIGPVIFYSISLLLSFVIVVMSLTVFAVVIFLKGSVSSDFFILFTGIIAVNLGISAVSLRGLIISYHKLSGGTEEPRVFLMHKQEDKHNENQPAGHMSLDSRYFTETELEIVDLLEKNGRRMLQSSLTSSMGTSRATISRALASLENKGIIVKVRKGVTNEIILSESYS